MTNAISARVVVENIGVLWVLLCLTSCDAIAGDLANLGRAINRGAIDIEKTGEKAVGDTGKTLEKAAHDAGKGGEKAVHDVGKTAEKAAQDTGKTLEKAVHDIGYALTVHPNDAKPNYPPFYVTLQGECPSSKNGNSWRSYLSKPTAGRQYVVVGVQFRYARKLKPPRALGTIDPAACYAVTFDPKKGFGGHRVFGYSRMYEPIYNDNHIRDGGLIGNPSSHQINVDGNLLRYNKAGEVYDRRGRIAGTMVCYLSNECEQYRY